MVSCFSLSRIVVCFLGLIAIASSRRVRLETDEAKAVINAEFALSELSKISDSGVHKSLTLLSILSAEEEDGIYHHNTLLHLELASPFFKSGNNAEKFRVVAMKHKVDGVMSIAIDEFPVMDEFAIERFWINKVEEKRSKREETFRRLEIEALLHANNERALNLQLVGEPLQEAAASASPIAKLDASYSTENILDVIDGSPRRLVQRQKAQELIDSGKFTPQESREEMEVVVLSLKQLYWITINKHADKVPLLSDFQKFKAQQVLDTAMLDLVQN